MRPKTVIASPRVVLGIVTLAYSRITDRTRGKPVEIDPLHAETTESHLVPRSDGKPQIRASKGVSVNPTDVNVEASESPDVQLLIAATRDTALGACHAAAEGTLERRCAMSSRLRV
jgi:hypothetical protein